jgi:hypothetical protein
VNADLRPRRGDDTQLNGSLSGSLDVVLETGEVLIGNGFMNVDYDLPGSQGIRLIGTLAVNVRPAPPPPATGKPGEKPAEKGSKPAGNPSPEQKNVKPANGEAAPTEKKP